MFILTGTDILYRNLCTHIYKPELIIIRTGIDTYTYNRNFAITRVYWIYETTGTTDKQVP